MTARDAVRQLHALGAKDSAEYFSFLAAHVPEFRLANGSRLCDATDFSAWLVELREALLELGPLFPACPRCGLALSCETCLRGAAGLEVSE